MKTRLILFFSLAIYVFQSQISGCQNQRVATTGEGRVQTYYADHTDSLIYQLKELDSFILLKKESAEVRNQFKTCRFTYKRIEGITEYYFQGLTKRINGPALPDIKTEDGQVWPPHGFQVIEQMLYQNYPNDRSAISAEIRLLQTDLLFMQNNLKFNTISSTHVNELIQHQFIRIATLGITGFDSPLFQASLEETEFSLLGIEQIFSAFVGINKNELKKKIQSAKFFLRNKTFDSFDRLAFITEHLMELSDLFKVPSASEQSSDSLMVKPFKGTFSDFIKGNGFNPDYYTSYAEAAGNPYKVDLGRRLFFDSTLSKSGKLSCGSCHVPELYFTDGKTKSGNAVHGGNLSRNTPSLYYSALQAGQFYDLRSITLEDQADQVMKSSEEFNFSSAEIVNQLKSDSTYISMFKRAFTPNRDIITGYQLRNAISSYVRSLSPFSSPFDQYIRGDKSKMSDSQIRGFNLFAGKAKCATCHFIPLFNGTIPPWLTKSESEIIGVPINRAWEAAVIDPDSGRYKINRMQELMFAFKTPTIRNVEMTGPYMHNGVYENLDDVIEFYHKGGGVGIGIDLPFQSLPFDSLILNKNEKSDIIAFMHSLTDKKIH